MKKPETPEILHERKKNELSNAIKNTRHRLENLKKQNDQVNAQVLYYSHVLEILNKDFQQYLK